MSGPREPLTPRQDGGGAPSPLCHQLPGLASFTTRTAAPADAVPRHPSWKGGIRASAKASSSSLGRVARRLLILLFRASADSLQNRMEKAYIRFCRQNYSLCYTLMHINDTHPVDGIPGLAELQPPDHHALLRRRGDGYSRTQTPSRPPSKPPPITLKPL